MVNLKGGSLNGRGITGRPLESFKGGYKPMISEPESFKGGYKRNKSKSKSKSKSKKSRSRNKRNTRRR